MKILMFYDYQLPIIACFSSLIAMITYWISLYMPKNNFVFKLGNLLVILSNFIFALTLLLRWIGEN
jgi:hypothetical protein